LENKETLSSGFFVFESWQTAEDVMVLSCDFTAVCHDTKTKTSTRQTFFNFQENLKKVNEYLPNLDVEVPV
jgi:hypothetical protein